MFKRHFFLSTESSPTRLEWSSTRGSTQEKNPTPARSATPPTPGMPGWHRTVHWQGAYSAVIVVFTLFWYSLWFGGISHVRNCSIDPLPATRVCPPMSVGTTRRLWQSWIRRRGSPRSSSRNRIMLNILSGVSIELENLTTLVQYSPKVPQKWLRSKISEHFPPPYLTRPSNNHRYTISDIQGFWVI